MRLPLSLRAVAAPLLTLALIACDDDEGGDSGSSTSIAELTTALAAAVGADPPSQEAEKNLKNVAGATCKVMAQTGCASGGISGATASRVDGSGGGIVDLLTAPRIGQVSWDDVLMAQTASIVPEAIPPLGATCVWNVDNGGWAGAGEIFGPVPDDRTRFEGYETDDQDPGAPAQPLTRTGQYFDVAPLVQNTPEDPQSRVNVEVTSNQATNGSSLVSFFLTGEVNPSNGDAIDLLMGGSSGSTSSSALDYTFTLDRTSALNTMQLQDLLVVTTLDAAAASGSFLIQKRNDPRQAMEFRYQITSSGLDIASGDVFVGQERVATMSGSRAAPVFEVQGSFSEIENLEFVYDELFVLDSRVIDLFFVGYCVGANTAPACQSMINILGLPPL
jgi:hypothetical protein